jgi:hypothetical protein
MQVKPMNRLEIGGIDVSHSRLVDLAKLADQAKPFYDWVSAQFQAQADSRRSLDEILKTMSEGDLRDAMERCYILANQPQVPILTDGVGRTYPHLKACYYFFSWLIRDTPQQRLFPLITRVANATHQTRAQAEVRVLAALITKYRTNVGTFCWEAVREVIIDRLEGSRRSIKGHEKETIGRTALVAAVQSHYKLHGNYGHYGGVEVPDVQVTVNRETFDVSANLLDENGRRVRRILMPIKTRETEGGGHAHLFTRDVMGALNAVQAEGSGDFLIVVIVARNWAAREAENIRERVDHAAIFDLSPNEFSEFGEVEQKRLNDFIAEVLDGTVNPKAQR